MNDPTPAQNRTESDERPESGLPADQGAREARYAEAHDSGRSLSYPAEGSSPLAFERRERIARFKALADAEVAAAASEAQAEVERVRKFAAYDIAKAEAEVERLREGITSLLPAECWVSRSERVRCIDFVGGTLGSGTFSLDMVCLPCRLRALLDPSPAATTDEDDEPLPDYLKELQRPAPLLGWGCAETGGAVSAKPGWWLHAPVSSSGEKRCDRCGNPLGDALHWTGVFPSSLHGNGAGSFTATSRHWQAVTCTLCLSLRERSDDWPDSVTPSAEGDRCPTCGSDDEPHMTGCGFMCDDPGGWHAARPVTPSAEGSE